MSSIILQGPKGLGVRAKLTELDSLAVLIAAVCHDNAHDGFTNLWHKNKDTTRFKEHGLEGTQEKFHFAISWQALTENTDSNFIKNLSYDEQNRFKLRMQGCIYATDMGRHVADLKTMKEMVAALKVESERDPIVSEEYEGFDLMTQQQKWVEMVVHFSDVSFQCRDIAVSNLWLQLLFDEFFNQGDLERESQIQVSFLCDRQGTSIYRAQPGFIKFCPLPLC